MPQIRWTRTAQRGLLRLEDRAHAALTERFKQLVLAEKESLLTSQQLLGLPTRESLLFYEPTCQLLGIFASLLIKRCQLLRAEQIAGLNVTVDQPLLVGVLQA